MEDRHLHPSIQERAGARRQELLQALLVGGAKLGWNNGLGKRPADGFAAAPAQERLGLAIPVHDAAAGVHGNERVVRRFDDGAGLPRPASAASLACSNCNSICCRRRSFWFSQRALYQTRAVRNTIVNTTNSAMPSAVS